MTAPAPANDNASVIDLRLGDWRDVLSDVECDLLLADPPYGERTHSNQKHDRIHSTQPKNSDGSWVTSRGIDYAHWTAEDVHAFVMHWEPRTRGWFVAFTSHDLVDAYTDALASLGRYVFAPLPAVQRGMNCRLAGDGPSSWTCWIIVARTAALHKWGTLPGAYVGNPFDPGQNTALATRRGSVVGSKPLWLMRELVRDYSRAGDLICDPTSGGATTLIAAAIEGRRAIGAELDPITFAKAQKRIARGYTPVMRFGDDRPKAVQQELLSAVAGGEER